MVEGREHTVLGIFELTYGIRKAIGITVYFNCFNKKKKNSEPTPIELKMQQYDDDVQTYLQSKKKS